MNVREVIDRTYLEWLYPSGVEQPTYDVLAEEIDTNVTELVLEGRVESVPDDSVLEIESELLLAKSSAGTTVTVQERGFLSTLSDTHLAGQRVIIDPTFPRKSVFDSLQACIGLLYGWGLRAVQREDTTYVTDLLDLPDGGEEILSIVIRRSSADEDWTRVQNWEEFPEWDPLRYRVRAGVAEGSAMRVVYTSDFTRPDSEEDDLSDAGVPQRIQDFLPVAIAGYLLQGQELTRVQIDEVRNLLASEGVPVGTALNIGQAMLQAFKREYVLPERQRQTLKHPKRIRVVRN